MEPDHQVAVYDETLRDGIQSPSALDPAVETKQEILRLMSRLNIEVANVGLPAASERNFEDVCALVTTIQQENLGIQPVAAARTVVNDVTRIAQASHTTGVGIEVYTFIGSSPLRQFAEDWKLEFLVEKTREAVRAGKREGMKVAFVTEDTMRSDPADIEVLFSAALDEGADRLCLCDTVGHATPLGTRNLIMWTRDFLKRTGHERVGIDWHGHNDRGLSLANALAAVSAGAHRVHGTCLGIGERVGNVPIDQLLVNLNLLGWSDRDLSSLAEYCHVASTALGFEAPINYPVIGRDAFRTATGVHAAAILKAQRKGDPTLADRVYSSVPAAIVGRKQRVDIGPMSGRSNAIFWMQERQIEPTQERIDVLLTSAKTGNRSLTDDECMALLGRGNS
jgi:2-isopropylmalate synthase